MIWMLKGVKIGLKMNWKKTHCNVPQIITTQDENLKEVKEYNDFEQMIKSGNDPENEI